MKPTKEIQELLDFITKQSDLLEEMRGEKNDFQFDKKILELQTEEMKITDKYNL